MRNMMLTGRERKEGYGFTSCFALICFALSLWMYSCSSSSSGNRLASSSSPYLQQHADNPVDWYEWGEEALAKARKENKPLLISIGYASCHWCHVMEKESFMDTAVANMMNANFICIKIDREERPDIDNIYINACQILTGNAGWPLNAFALPDGKPFFAGTYYTKGNWMGLLKQISLAYREKNDLVLKQAEALTKGIAEQEFTFLSAESSTEDFSKTSYHSLFDSLYTKLDLQNGGLAVSPKFPIPSIAEFLLQYHFLTGEKRALDAAVNTLTRMARGGIYDQLAGGFSRYATDKAWMIPHFEKMLYDNGQLISAYAHAYQVTGNKSFKTVVDETIEFLRKEMRDPSGGFYSSVNAETESEEGKYYVWTYEEVSEILGNEDAAFFGRYYNVRPEGNWYKGRNILYLSDSPDLNSTTDSSLDQKLAGFRKKLLAVREKRVKPSIDDKILTSWNAILIKGLVDAFDGTGREEYLGLALENGRFLASNMMDDNGHLWRNFKDGKVTIDGFLDDYAWAARAFIRLYQATFDKQWLDQAREITEYAIAHFYDNKTAMFYYTSNVVGVLGEGKNHVASLIARKLDIQDNAIPSSNAIMAGVLYDLGVYFESNEFSTKSRGMFSRIAGKLNGLTSYYSQWCTLAGLYSYGSFEVAIMGKEALEKSRSLQRHYLPNCLYLGNTDKENLPLLENKLTDDRTLIYVCTNRMCKLPVEEVDKAVKQIRKF